MIEEFKRQYVDKCLNGEGFDEELNVLFDAILQKQFNNDHELMDALIQSIVDENTKHEPSELDMLKQENEELKQRQEMAEEALLLLSDMMLGGG